MRIVLLGANGMLGRYLQTYFKSSHDLLALTRQDIDFSVIDEVKILSYLRECISSESVIVNAAGVIKQRSNSVIDMVMVNAVLPHVLAKLKEETGCKVIHVTTDCVFSGKKGGYVETDEHDCTDDYGKSKSLGENSTLTIIRTSIIGEEKANKKSLLEWVISNKGKTIDGYTNHLWNGVTCLEFAKYIDSIIQKQTYWNGVRHIFSPNTVSKYELLNIINEVYGLGIMVKEKRTASDCFRNLSTVIDSDRVTKTLYEQIRELKGYVLNES